MLPASSVLSAAASVAGSGLPADSMSEIAAQPGWRATLDLQLQNVDGVARVTRRRHSGPLLVQRAFYPERASPASRLSTAQPMSEPCHVYIIHPPGGLASGDGLELCATVECGAHALLTTPAAGKFYRRGEAGVARLSQRLRVDGGVLEWLPQENIFYPNAAAALATVVHLSAGARFIGWEVGCFGLPASGRTLESGEVRQSFELWQDDRPLLLERLTIKQAALSARWGLADHSTTGTWLGFPAGPAELQCARAHTETSCGGLTVACTLVDEVLVCRALGQRADHVIQVFIGLWRALRPAFTGREAVAPRVWAT
ncbi:MAG: urease accessory protein [Gammaproteobacteria bacterium]|nr:urease accessory protein [Gammaproteobacteria bacterium]